MYFRIYVSCGSDNFLLSILTLLIASVSALIGFTKYTNPTGSVRRKYGKRFSKSETKFLFENFKIPLSDTVFGNKILEFRKEILKFNFTSEMCQKALCQRVNFYLERELPEEIQKYEEREKRRKTCPDSCRLAGFLSSRSLSSCTGRDRNTTSCSFLPELLPCHLNYKMYYYNRERPLFCFLHSYLNYTMYYYD